MNRRNRSKTAGKEQICKRSGDQSQVQYHEQATRFKRPTQIRAEKKRRKQYPPSVNTTAITASGELPGSRRLIARVYPAYEAPAASASSTPVIRTCDTLPGAGIKRTDNPATANAVAISQRLPGALNVSKRQADRRRAVHCQFPPLCRLQRRLWTPLQKTPVDRRQPGVLPAA